jgi:threonylcarbamoyladenosine tRNA methylthiotransferase MtaB
VVLTGIHVSSYGVPGEYGLIDVVEEVQHIPGIERIRLGSLEPRIVTEEFAKRASLVTKLCPHFHLSLQSGCDATLQRMNRKYTAEEFCESVQYLRKYFDHPAITTDVIVGFPGETEEEFEETRRFLEKIHFYEMHVFKFSIRKGTRAERMPDQIPEQVKSARSEILINLAKKMSEEFRQEELGSEVCVLMEEEVEIDGQKFWTGFTKDYVRYAVKSEENLHNRLVTGKAEQFLTDEILFIENYQVEK